MLGCFCQPGSFLFVHSDVVGLDGGLLHPASPLRWPAVLQERKEGQGDIPLALFEFCHCDGFFI
jgi:hypothetical protein